MKGDTVTVLIPGYAAQTETGWKASSTTTLVRTENRTIVVDPGANKQLLLDTLKAEELTPSAIDSIFLTHYHPDHALLTALFENAVVFDGDIQYEDDKETEFSNTLPDTDIRVIATPGHAHEHASLIIETEERGTVVIAADLWWWMDNEEQKTDDYQELIEREDPFTKNREELRESRKKVLETADWVIPGHGKIFKNLHKK